MDYPVPNFGADEDVLSTGMHIGAAQAERGLDFHPALITPEDYEPEFMLNPMMDRMPDMLVQTN